ncbi:sulfite exporter TauE/SafE family protein [Noviherbaspirillum sp. CPCC 100848]|uniref:Probable membrane transporter protein n=1 Tax=Noviherbaspirillum album TaxID=3080276 RepID=A0ABU6JHY3_9BURK|nr:sulfite exporter TauE/SafE family protein [Noviherbaspirillum sp. CPCC 100848]MEC4722699.1 sulfite exporter TauE/SafE family protein [Noviherbaspirillum sp. CPCC 100848]
MKLYRKLFTEAEQSPPLPLTQTSAAIAQPLVIRLAMGFTSLVLLTLTVFVVGRFLITNDSSSALSLIDQTLSDKMFWSAVAVGFLAQAIDGALGMAYGVTSTTFLLSAGATPAMASASVHIAEIFTTGVSGFSHAKVGNVNKKLFLRLLVPGMIGAVLGAVLITQVDGKAMKPFISAYLLIMGIYILSKAWRKITPRIDEPKHVGKLALFGGFVDSAGGGGWGPVVTTSLVGSGNDPRTTIGSVNFAEFFLALAGAASFTLMVGTGVWVLVLGLVIGGLFAAPFAAMVTQRLKTRTLLLLVGTLISVVSIFNLYKALLA